MDMMHFTILEDGTITVKTSEISDGNHLSADALMTNLDSLMGGHVDIKDNTEELAKAHAHQHKNGKAFAGGHSHDGGHSFHRH